MNHDNNTSEEDDGQDQHQQQPPPIFPPNNHPLKAVVTGFIEEIGDSEFKFQTTLGDDTMSVAVDEEKNNDDDETVQSSSSSSSFSRFLSLSDWAPIAWFLERRLNQIVQDFIIVVDHKNKKNQNNRSKHHQENEDENDVTMMSNKKSLFKISIPLPCSSSLPQ